MANTNIVIYISENNPACDDVLDLMEDLDVSYRLKNVTKNRSYKRELQAYDIYGTPATFIGQDEVILGPQKSRIKEALGIFE